MPLSTSPTEVISWWRAQALFPRGVLKKPSRSSGSSQMVELAVDPGGAVVGFHMPVMFREGERDGGRRVRSTILV
jgi:hypothetical protein